MLYIDQPAGTGFSYVTNPEGYVKNERTIGMELWNMMLKFYELYPKYANLDLYIFGESYGKKYYFIKHVMFIMTDSVIILSICTCTAGHYIPATAQVILESNSIYDKNLKAIGIGNGWVDPYVQYNAYAKVYIIII